MTIRHNEQDIRHGGRLHWVQGLDFPIRDEAPELALKNEDVSKLVLIPDFHVYIFDLSKEEDKEYYIWVYNRILANMFTLIYQERKWVPDQGKCVIYMEWCQVYYELPPSLRQQAVVSSAPMI